MGITKYLHKPQVRIFIQRGLRNATVPGGKTQLKQLRAYIRTHSAGHPLDLPLFQAQITKLIQTNLGGKCSGAALEIIRSIAESIPVLEALRALVSQLLIHSNTLNQSAMAELVAETLQKSPALVCGLLRLIDESIAANFPYQISVSEVSAIGLVITSLPHGENRKSINVKIISSQTQKSEWVNYIWGIVDLIAKNDSRCIEAHESLCVDAILTTATAESSYKGVHSFVFIYI